MEILQLRYFKAIAENGNLTKTAAELFVSPPSLSLTISHLERELGTTLFDRVGGRLHLNERGREFLRHVNEGLDSLNLGVGLVKALSVKSETTVTIASTNSSVFNKMVSSFMLSHPEITVCYQYFWRTDFEDEELLREFDYILSQLREGPFGNLTSHTLMVELAILAAVPCTHRLAGRKSIRMEELAEERFIMPRHGFGPRYLNACRDAGFEPKVIAECDFLLRVQLLRDGVGITFSSENSDIASLAGNAVMIPIEGIEQQYSQAIFWDRRRKFGPAAKLFKDYAMEYFKYKRISKLDRSPGMPPATRGD